MCISINVVYMYIIAKAIHIQCSLKGNIICTDFMEARVTI